MRSFTSASQGLSTAGSHGTGTSLSQKARRGHDVVSYSIELQPHMQAEDILNTAKKELRCVDWEHITRDLMSASHSKSDGDDRVASLTLARPAEMDTIDYFMSHSWHDDPERKWKELTKVADKFCKKRRRYPTFWLDKVCIDQSRISDGLKALPVNVMACSQMLVLCGETYADRLWCVWELCTLFSFMDEDRALERLRFICYAKDGNNSVLQRLMEFKASQARCYDPNEEAKLFKIIRAVGEERFNDIIRRLARSMQQQQMEAPYRSATGRRLTRALTYYVVGGSSDDGPRNSWRNSCTDSSPVSRGGRRMSTFENMFALATSMFDRVQSNFSATTSNVRDSLTTRDSVTHEQTDENGNVPDMVSICSIATAGINAADVGSEGNELEDCLSPLPNISLMGIGSAASATSSTQDYLEVNVVNTEKSPRELHRVETTNSQHSEIGLYPVGSLSTLPGVQQRIVEPKVFGQPCKAVQECRGDAIASWTVEICEGNERVEPEGPSKLREPALILRELSMSDIVNGRLHEVLPDERVLAV